MRNDRQQTRQLRLGRRGLLKAAGLITGAAALGAAGCSPPAEEAVDSDLITIPDTGAKLPTGDVQLRWVDSGDAKVAFWNQFWPKYQQKHPNIKVQYDPMPWTKIKEILPLGVRNKTAHDVFALQSNVFYPRQAVEWGWVAPLDDVVPNFAEWKAAFPEGSLVDGIHIHDGKVYSFPVASNKRCNNGGIVLGNAKLLKQAGVAFGDKPPKWTELREAAKKITAAGKGQFYGIVLPGEPDYLQSFVLGLAHAAGKAHISGVGSGIDPKTGEYVYNSDEVAAAVELMLALKADGSILPGSNSMTGQDSWPRIQRGNVGLILGGAWMAARWEQEDADFAYVAAGCPVPDSGTALPQAANPADTGNSSWLYKESKVKEVAGDVFSYIGSAEGQTAWATLAGVSNPSVFPKALETVRKNASPKARKVLELGEQLVDAPALVVRNPEISKVAAARKKPTPDFPEVLQAIYLGEVSDPKKALQDVQDRANKALDTAIAEAAAKGAKVTRQDFVFPNWDPTKNYTKSDYAAL